MLTKENLLTEMKGAENPLEKRYNVLPWYKGCKGLAQPSAVQFFISTKTEYLLSMICYSIKKLDTKFYSITITQRRKTTTVKIYNSQQILVQENSITNLQIPEGEYWFDILPIENKPGFVLLSYRWE